MKLLLRKETSYVEDLKSLGCVVSVMPPGVYYSSFDAVVLDEPHPREIYDEITLTESFPTEPKIVIVGDYWMYRAINNIFHDLIFVQKGGNTADLIVNELKTKGNEDGGFYLTEREGSVLNKIAYGLCNKEICYDLSISDRSLRRAKENIYRKTGLCSKEELTLLSLFGPNIRSSRRTSDRE